MAVAEAFSGTETVSTTEWSLTTDSAGPDVNTAAGTYVCFLDLSALALGDMFEFRVYGTVLNGGTQRVVHCYTFLNALGADSAVWMSEPYPMLHGWEMTLKKTAGTDRSISWSIRTP